MYLFEQHIVGSMLNESLERLLSIYLFYFNSFFIEYLNSMNHLIFVTKSVDVFLFHWQAITLSGILGFIVSFNHSGGLDKHEMKNQS